MSLDTREQAPGGAFDARQESDAYLQKRSLKSGSAGWVLLAGLGVSYVISGDFSGWNFGIGFAGFGGMLIAFAILVVMYYGMIFSIGEMSAAMPHTGGAYSFARTAMGPWGGLITGAAETIEYVATTAVITGVAADSDTAITDPILPLRAGTPGVDPATGQLAGADAYSQARQIVHNFVGMLAAVGASLDDVMHVHVYLKDCADFAEMNRAYAEVFGAHRPARTVIGVADLPKPGARMTMDLMAYCPQAGREGEREGLPPDWL